ncbi:unnamed protein product, partial [Ostreobium quekettii]
AHKLPPPSQAPNATPRAAHRTAESGGALDQVGALIGADRINGARQHRWRRMATIPASWDAALLSDSDGIDGARRCPSSMARVARSPIWASPAVLAPGMWHKDIAPRCKDIVPGSSGWPYYTPRDAPGGTEIVANTEKRAVFQIPPLGLSPFIVDHDQRLEDQAQIEANAVEHAPEGVVGARRLGYRAVELKMTLQVAGFII